MGKNLEQRATGGNVDRQEEDNSTWNQIGKMENEFRAALPKGIEAVQLVRDLHTQLRTIKNLDKCDQKSVLGAAMTCAQLGLRPGVLGQSWILPYWNNKTKSHSAQLIIGYQGYIELAYRSDKVAMLQARAIHENDTFELVWGAEADTITHKPAPFDVDPGEIIGYYAVGRTTAGGYVFTRPMSRAEMERHRDQYAPRYNGQITGPWKTEFDEMALKTMVRKLMKFLPKSTQMAQAYVHDNSVRFDPRPEAVDETPTYVDGETVPDEGVPPPAEEERLRAVVIAIMDAEKIPVGERQDWILGLTQRDVNGVQELSASDCRTIIAEFPNFQSPTGA